MRTDDRSEGQRRLYWHGMLLFLAGLLMGAVVQSVANPRMALSAHVGTLMNGTFLVALGAAWARVALTPATAVATLWLAVVASYANCVSLFLAAVLGTGQATPIAGAGHAGTAVAEAVVTAGLTAGALLLLVACALVLWGLRRRAVAA